jgi:hypothetical protein
MASSDEILHVSLPFELKGGSPFIYRVKLPGGEFDVVVSPVVSEIAHAVGLVNPGNPGMPVFRMQVQMNAATRKVEP